MACPPGTTIRYDIFFRTFPDPINHFVKVDELLTFCLNINGTTITGTVNSIANVTGTNQALVGGVERITLGFPWGATRVIVEGFTFPDNAGRRELLVTFRAIPPDGVVTAAAPQGTTPTASALVLVAPDVGDTGTGTGQQT
jgi:hypothetical protein